MAKNVETNLIYDPSQLFPKYTSNSCANQFFLKKFKLGRSSSNNNNNIAFFPKQVGVG